MKVTHRTDYAIHMLADLANAPGKPVGLRSLAEGHKVTYAYARTVQQGLQKAGIISTARGVNGGILLARDLSDITLLEVFEAAQDPLDVAFGTDGAVWCSCEGACISDALWESTRKALAAHLSKITMKQVIAGKK
jgi:Rrf2 family protein